MKKQTEKEFIAPWEKAFDRVLTPLEEFIHRQTTSGILLMLCAIAALYIANSQWNEAYHHLLEMPFTIGLPEFQLSKSLHHWINDGLMAVFFFVIGLELIRRQPRRRRTAGCPTLHGQLAERYQRRQGYRFVHQTRQVDVI